MLRKVQTMKNTATSVPLENPTRKNWMLILLTLILFSGFTLYLYAETKGSKVLSFKEAMALAKEGKNDEAIAAVKRIVQENQDSDNGEAHIKLGLIYFKTHQYENALDEFGKVSALKPNSPMAYNFTGLIYEKIAITKTDKKESTDLKKKALDAWKNYLTYAQTDKKRPETHKNIGISIEKCIKRAEKHVELLNEELVNENK